MRHTPTYLMTDPAEVARLVRANPWATYVSAASTGLVASHYPTLLEEDAEDLTILSHFGRPDEQLHELGQHEVLVIVQGPHDYVSASWYPEGQNVPTWNHVTAHLYGVPEILSDDENFAVLTRLTHHFEDGFEDGRAIELDEERSRRIAKGTVGLRMRVTRFDARAKLSQNKAPEVQERIVSELDVRNPALAEEMRRTLRRG
ncbi:FMN-binding negative transcriptional regulator [Amnibacterium kyonggiense]